MKLTKRGKIILGVVAGVVILGAIGASRGGNNSNTTQSSISSEQSNSPNHTDTSIDAQNSSSGNTADSSDSLSSAVEPIDDKTQIKEWVTSYIDKNYTFTEIDKIIVNDDLGTDVDDDYVVLVYLTWEQKNSGTTSKEVLNMYSSDMAARIYEDLPINVQELAIFWTVPYLSNASAKISFDRVDGGMKYSDTIFDKNFD